MARPQGRILHRSRRDSIELDRRAHAFPGVQQIPSHGADPGRLGRLVEQLLRFFLQVPRFRDLGPQRPIRHHYHDIKSEQTNGN